MMFLSRITSYFSMPEIVSAPSHIGIAIVAPGGYAPDQAAMQRAVDGLQKQGCLVRNYYDPSAKYQRFGAPDAERLAQLLAAAQDPDVQIVLALRGGYGMIRLLPFIDYRLLADSGKLFVGHSDFTALQLGLLAKTGMPTFAGPMICDDFTRDDPSAYTMRQFWQCVSNGTHAIEVTAGDNPSVQASGRLWGGNLAMITHLIGTPYFPEIDAGILFIEDISEHPYRIERMLLQLLHAGVLARQQAMLLGDFSGYRLSAYDNGYDFTAMLTFLRAQLAVPILTGLPFGHIPAKATLVVGCQAQLDGNAAGFTLQMRAYPALDARVINRA